MPYSSIFFTSVQTERNIGLYLGARWQLLLQTHQDIKLYGCRIVLSFDDSKSWSILINGYSKFELIYYC